ncbi:Protein kinase [Seminavis robusta]|uniref:Protein kinase n=1 Tax=Seminavis robusta TaxID=568900 RepID=A0A9N8HCU6_9STRA|nr:Protein kinase [Seminavis robusta]|eukprot:Sro429_g141050.1 Protein kinase (519) ;mRNA; f:25476-27032
MADEDLYDDENPGSGILYPRSASLSHGPTASSRSSSPYPNSPHPPPGETERRLSLLSAATNSSDPYGSSYSMTSDPTNIHQIIQHQSDDQNERESGDNAEESQFTAVTSATTPTPKKSGVRHYKVEDYPLPKDVSDQLVAHMEKRVTEVLEHSRFLQRHCGFDVPRFSHTDVETGEPIARGGFAVIMEIKWFTTGCELNEDENEDKEYVLKYLNPKLIAKFLQDKDNDKVFAGAKDLVLEAHILSAVNHTNIIALRGLSTHGIHGYKATGGRADGFFMVLDRLTGTLSQRIFTDWKEKADANPHLQHLDNLTTNTMTMDFFVDRIRTALDVASALIYLHDHQILHRDIKPANIGFDANGVLKVFDFGLAVEVPYSDKPNQLYDLSGNTGTPRFMAPEVMKRKPYNFKADVYSFSILLWEMLALEKPYQGMDGEAVRETVALKSERPPMPERWPENIAKLFKRGWAKKIDHRPTMAEMHHCLTFLLASPLQPTPLPSKHSSMLPGKKLFRARRSLDNNK